jgi:transposase
VDRRRPHRHEEGLRRPGRGGADGAGRPGAANPFCGHVFVFRGRRGDILKVLWFDGQGLMLLAKRLERGRFVWPQATSGSVSLTPAQLSMLLEGIDWRMPVRTHTPELAA